MCVHALFVLRVVAKVVVCVGGGARVRALWWWNNIRVLRAGAGGRQHWCLKQRAEAGTCARVRV